MPLIANSDIAEATLINVAGELVPLVEVAGMNTCQPVDVRRNFVVFLGPQHKVPVVGHQAVCDDAHRDPSPRALHKSLKMQVIVHATEQRLSVHAAVEDVIDIPAFQSAALLLPRQTARATSAPLSGARPR